MSHELIAKLRAEEDRISKFGHVRPIIQTVFQGQRLVAVGHTLFYSPNWNTFIDFLFDYMKHILGLEWGRAEQVKPLAQRHPIMQWNDSVGRFTKSHPPGPDGICEATPDGPTQAYLALAYDLYVLKDHQLLQERLVQRLKHRDQFQGARYELFVAASCIRANYEIVYEDEADPTVRHNEFVAVHRPTGQSVVVEAKSRHRVGVLGQPGEAEDPNRLRAGISQLVRKALKKPAPHPRVIFIDVNFPPIRALSGMPRWIPDAHNTLQRILRAEGGQSPWNLVFLTNHPYHYGPEGVSYPGEQTAAHLPSQMKPPIAVKEALEALIKAVEQFGKYPTSFPQEWEQEDIGSGSVASRLAGDSSAALSGEHTESD